MLLRRSQMSLTRGIRLTIRRVQARSKRMRKKICKCLINFLIILIHFLIYDESRTNKCNMDPIQVPVGPITRAKAKKFKENLNALILRILDEESS